MRAPRTSSHQGDNSDCAACQQFYSIASLARMFELSPKTIRRMIIDGQLKAKRVRASIRIPHSEMVKALQDYM